MKQSIIMQRICRMVLTSTFCVLKWILIQGRLCDCGGLDARHHMPGDSQRIRIIPGILLSYTLDEAICDWPILLYMMSDDQRGHRFLGSLKNDLQWSSGGRELMGHGQNRKVACTNRKRQKMSFEESTILFCWPQCFSSMPKQHIGKSEELIRRLNSPKHKPYGYIWWMSHTSVYTNWTKIFKLFDPWRQLND